MIQPLSKQIGLVLAVVAATLVCTFASDTSSAAPTDNLRLIKKGSDDDYSYTWGYEIRGSILFHNYDFTDDPSSMEVEGTALSDNVDWPVTMIFLGQSSVNKVKKLFEKPFSSTGGAMYFRAMEDLEHYVRPEWTRWGSPWWYTDSDKGRKTGLCSSGTLPRMKFSTEHYRIYGHPYYDGWYTPSWGWFTVATTHVDVRECDQIANRDYYCCSEQTENRLANLAASRLGRKRVKRDKVNLFNADSGNTVDGNHTFETDGKATVVWLP
ncbi:MAG TPA: hypothetical protein VMF31_00580 [Solirubrobacterales bacterium]|nr:hypothetical protein [Solirubrobacterales bacterium]